jgi:hypothetical protein
MIGTMFGESYAKELWKRPVEDNTVGIRASVISEDPTDQLIIQLQISLSALQVDKEPDIHI